MTDVSMIVTGGLGDLGSQNIPVRMTLVASGCLRGQPVVEPEPAVLPLGLG